jgi:hypothetical protein
MRRVVLFTTITALAGLVGGPAEAREGPAAAETTVVVDTAEEYVQAIIDLSADESGPHRLVIGDDLDLSTVAQPEYTSGQPLTVDGGSNTITNDSGYFLRSDGTAPAVTVQDLNLTGPGNGVFWPGRLVLRGVTFSHAGRGGTAPLISLVYAPAGFGHPVSVLIEDGTFVDNRGTNLVSSSGSLVVVRTLIQHNDTNQATLRASNRLRLVDTVVTGNLARLRAAVDSHRGRIELVRSAVRGTRHLTSGNAVQTSRTVYMSGSTVRGNQPVRQGVERVAIRAKRLNADRSTILHAAPACNVQVGMVTRSTVSDGTCDHP